MSRPHPHVAAKHPLLSDLLCGDQAEALNFLAVLGGITVTSEAGAQ